MTSFKTPFYLFWPGSHSLYILPKRFKIEFFDGGQPVGICTEVFEQQNVI